MVVDDVNDPDEPSAKLCASNHWRSFSSVVPRMRSTR